MGDETQLAAIDRVQRCLLLSVLAIASNLFLAIPLVGDINLVFGSVFAFIAIFILPRHFTIVVVSCHLVSKLLIGYSPLFLLVHLFEILIIYLLVNRYVLILIASLGFWLVLGIPLLWLISTYGEVFLQELSVVIAIEKALTGILCASIAATIVALLPKKYLQEQFNSRENTLASNIFAICASILVVPLLIVSFIFITTSSRLNELSLVEKSEAIASSVSQITTAYIDKHAAVIEQVASMISNQSSLQNIHQVINEAQASVPSFFYITKTNDLGEFTFFAPEAFNELLVSLPAERMTVIDREFFQQAAISGETSISGALVSRALVATPMINIATPIMNDDDFDGIVFGSISLLTIRDLRLAIESVLNGELMVITDADNKLIYTSQSLSIPLLEAFLARPSYHYAITELPVISYEDQRFAYSKKQNAYSWNIYTLTNTEAFTSNIRTNFVIAALSLLLVIVVFLLFAYKLSQQISEPLMALIEPADKAPETLGRFAHSKEFSEVANKLKRSQFLMQNFENRLKQQVTEKTEQLESLNLQLAAQAREDGMTHLLNRSGFDEMANTAIKTNYRLGQSFSVALLDIDHFKKLNDTYGHPFGDKCLQAFSALLQRNCKRDTDIIGRYGGEEFILFMSGKDVDAHHRLMERIHEQTRKIKLKPSDSDETVSFSVSIGLCSVLGNVNMKLAEIVKLADEEMYKCKRNGRDQISKVTVGFSEPS